MQTVDRDAVPSPGELGDQTHLRTGAVVGNYLFEPDVLAAALSESSRLGDTDFGTHLLPRLLCTHRVVAYDFARNRVPGVQPYEEPACWRDVGTIEAYRDAQRDVVGPTPRFSLWNDEWPPCLTRRGDAGPRARRGGFEARRSGCKG